MNTAIITGRITKDPEVRYMQDGTATVSFNMAVDRGYKDRQGNRVTDFIPCVAWNQPADFISKFVKKGNLLEIQGQIQVRNYQTQSGENRVMVEVYVDKVNNLTPKSENEQAQQQKPQPQPKPQGAQYNPTSTEYPDLEDEFADLPF